MPSVMPVRIEPPPTLVPRPAARGALPRASGPQPPLAGRLGRTTLDRLHAEHGASFHLLDLGRLQRNVADLFAALRAEYPRVMLAHSYKTSHAPAVARTMARAGALPEVVSSTEYALAMRLGADPADILVNGPAKSDAFLEQALLAGSTVNVDSVGEAVRIAAIAGRHPSRRLNTGLRCHVALPGRPPSRFGLDEASGELDAAARRLRERPNVSLRGLHCHVGGDRSAASYALRTKRLIELADRLFPVAPPDWIDVGGGLAGRMDESLRRQFATPPPDYADYARAIGGAMRARWGGRADAPALMLEPGMALLADTAEFVTRVEAVKRIGDRWHATVAGSVYNVKPTLNAFDLPVTVMPATRAAGEPRRWIVGGSTCMEIDVLHAGLTADLAPGDDLVFSNVGAYTFVLTPPFINTAPAIVAVDPDLGCRTARRAETLDDQFATWAIGEPET